MWALHASACRGAHDGQAEDHLQHGPDAALAHEVGQRGLQHGHVQREPADQVALGGAVEKGLPLGQDLGHQPRPQARAEPLPQQRREVGHHRVARGGGHHAGAEAQQDGAEPGRRGGGGGAQGAHRRGPAPALQGAGGGRGGGAAQLLAHHVEEVADGQGEGQGDGDGGD
jgi:hypothetical protein